MIYNTDWIELLAASKRAGIRHDNCSRPTPSYLTCEKSKPASTAPSAGSGPKLRAGVGVKSYRQGLSRPKRSP